MRTSDLVRAAPLHVQVEILLIGRYCVCTYMYTMLGSDLPLLRVQLCTSCTQMVGSDWCYGVWGPWRLGSARGSATPRRWLPNPRALG